LSHKGVVVLFDRDSGEPSAIVEAGELTAIRTAAVSAAATEALARTDARALAILGTGEQARRHLAAMRLVRPIERVTIWGRSAEKAKALAAEMGAQASDSVEAAVRDADIVCATTASPEPILAGRWLKPGAHVNLVGSSRAGPAEADNDLVLRARFFADHRDGVLAQGSEFLNAKAAGLIGDNHVVGEIGEVFAGTLAGRQDDGQLTVYKSLGSIVQDLAAAAFVVDRMVR
jgi:ornithine cyclodeaminase